MHVRYTFAFSATSLQASFTAPLFETFGLRHLIEGANVYDPPTNLSQVVEFFSSAPYLSRHTALVFLARLETDGTIEVHEIRWSHPKIRPSGKQLPLQCHCGALQCFAVKDGRVATESVVTCQLKSCRRSFSIIRDKEYAVTRSGEGGQWLHRVLTAEAGNQMDVD